MSKTLAVGGRLAISAVVLAVFLHRERVVLVVVHWYCIRLHSLFARVSPMLPCAPAGIESYQGLKAVALKLQQHAQVVESPWSAVAWR